MGVGCGAAYERTGFLLAPVLAHATYNAIMLAIVPNAIAPAKTEIPRCLLRPAQARLCSNVSRRPCWGVSDVRDDKNDAWNMQTMSSPPIRRPGPALSREWVWKWRPTSGGRLVDGQDAR